MAAIHEQEIERASRVLEAGEELEYDFKTVERAHKEYMSFKRALLKKEKSPAMEALSVSRHDCFVVIRMDTPRHLFPVPTKRGKVEVAKSESEKKRKNSEVERILTLAKEDLEEGMITKEEYEGILKQYETEEKN
jgi:hypothetical protein